MTRDDDHRHGGQEPPDEPQRQADAPSAEPSTEPAGVAPAPDPFQELERMFGDLTVPPAEEPGADPLPSPPPLIQPARLEIPPLLEAEPEPSDGTEPTAPEPFAVDAAPLDPVEPIAAQVDVAAEPAFEEPIPLEEPIVPETEAVLSESDEPMEVVSPTSAREFLETEAVETEAVETEVAETEPAVTPLQWDTAEPMVTSVPDSEPAPAPPMSASDEPGALDTLMASLDRQTPPALDVTLAAAAAAPAPVGERCILFEVDDTRYALQMGQVIEVADVPPVTPLPHVPSWLLGVSNLRGDILAVLDLRLFLDLGRRPQSTTTRMLIAQGTGGLQAGLVVDAVHGVASVDMQALRPPTAPMDDPVLPLLRGVHQQDDRLLAVLDTDKLLRSDALRPFAAAHVHPGTAQNIDPPASRQGHSAPTDLSADPFS